MESMVVDGRAFEVNAGRTILELLNRSGIEIPQICYVQQLGAIETCDTCLVEVDGKLVRACATLARAGQRVMTASPRAIEARKRALELVLTNHELVCSVCDKNGNCVLHSTVLRTKEVTHQNYRPKPYPKDSSNPFYVYDPSHCILCGRCVEACQDLVVNEVIRIDWKANPPRVIWDENAPIDRSSCVSCGTCVSVCPVDALMPKGMQGEAGLLTGISDSAKSSMTRLIKAAEPSLGGFRPILRASEIEAQTRGSVVHRTKTVCTFCGVGCSFEVWTRDRKVLQIQPRPESPANGMATCIKGKFGWDYVNSPDRLMTPLLREGDHFRRASWEEAITFIAERLRKIRKEAGPDAIGFIANCTGSNEEAFLLQKLARAVIGTHNIDNCARYCQAPASTGLSRTVGIGADSGSFEDIVGSDLVITVGSNTAESHPVLAGKIKSAQKLRGQKLIVVDLRSTKMAERADLFVRPRPGTDLVLLNTIARYILDQGWEAKTFIETRTTNFDAYRASLEPYTLPYGAEITGLPIDQIVRAANMIHDARSVCILWAMGVTQHQAGTETSTAICDLLLLTGNFGRPCTGGYPLRGHCNVQGVSDFGALPTFLGGYSAWNDPAAVARHEKAWDVKLPTRKGLTSTEMVDAALSGQLRAMLIFGEDKLLADAHESKVAAALRKLDLLVVCELFPTATSQLAHVVLPAAATLEREGTFVNTERRIQRFHRALAPPGACRPEFEIVQQLANALGANWHYASPADVMREAASVVPRFAGVRYDRLEGFASQRWPVAENGEESPFLYADRFAFPDGKAHFHPPVWIPPLASDAEFDLYLNNGRMLEQFHWGNVTSRDAGLLAKVPDIYLEVSPELARERELADGDLVRVRSANGAVRLKVLVTDRVQGRVMWVGIHARGEGAINQLTVDARDPTTQTGAYKELPVALEKIPRPAGGGTSPLPIGSPRRYRGVPQLGVQVVEKWRRSDYVPLTD
jgi:formate dehydrogenase major subunit